MDRQLHNSIVEGYRLLLNRRGSSFKVARQARRRVRRTVPLSELMVIRDDLRRRPPTSEELEAFRSHVQPRAEATPDAKPDARELPSLQLAGGLMLDMMIKKEFERRVRRQCARMVRQQEDRQIFFALTRRVRIRHRQRAQ